MFVYNLSGKNYPILISYCNVIPSGFNANSKGCYGNAHS